MSEEQKVANVREIKEVDEITHNWFVCEKKTVHKANYYLLQDCKLPTTNKDGEEEGEFKPLNIFRVIAESLDTAEKFSGKIMDIPDIKEKFTSIKSRAVGKTHVEDYECVETYIHRLNDVGEVPDAVASDIFGGDLVGFVLQLRNAPEIRENLFYKQSLLKKKSVPQVKTSVLKSK
jgi:hypothetical protein